MIKILYVEDEPFLAKIVKETLEGQSYKVTLIDNGGEAVATYKNGDFDVCVLDIMLPGVNGYDIAVAIRKKSADIPILFLTAKDQTEDVIKGFKVGGNDYLRKPFSIEELMARIENLVAMTATTSIKTKSSGIKIGGDCTFYPDAMDLVVHEETISLSHKESIILKELSLHQNQVLDRQALLLKCWGDDSFFNSRTLDVYISKLRSYLKADPKIKIITLKGVGYRFLVEA